jgi:hypothetical protein
VDHRDRLAWADKHLEALDSAVKVLADGSPYIIVRNFDEQTRQHRAEVTAVGPFPTDWSLRVSDIVHSLRSALDNLTYALAVKHSGAVKADTDSRLQFPIADTQGGWDGKNGKGGQKERVRLLSASAQAEIKRLQPCNRLDKTISSGLSILRQLSNTDKHKHLVLTLYVTTDANVTLSGTGIPPGTRVGGFRGPLDHKTVIALWNFEPHQTPSDMEVRGEMTFDIVFGATGPAPRHPVRNILTFIRNQIRDEIFPALEPFL